MKGSIQAIAMTVVTGVIVAGCGLAATTATFDEGGTGIGAVGLTVPVKFQVDGRPGNAFDCAVLEGDAEIVSAGVAEDGPIECDLLGHGAGEVRIGLWLGGADDGDTPDLEVVVELANIAGIWIDMGTHRLDMEATPVDELRLLEPVRGGWQGLEVGLADIAGRPLNGRGELELVSSGAVLAGGIIDVDEGMVALPLDDAPVQGAVATLELPDGGSLELPPITIWGLDALDETWSLELAQVDGMGDPSVHVHLASPDGDPVLVAGGAYGRLSTDSPGVVAINGYDGEGSACGGFLKLDGVGDDNQVAFCLQDLCTTAAVRGEFHVPGHEECEENEAGPVCSVMVMGRGTRNRPGEVRSFLLGLVLVSVTLARRRRRRGTPT